MKQKKKKKLNWVVYTTNLLKQILYTYISNIIQHDLKFSSFIYIRK